MVIFDCANSFSYYTVAIDIIRATIYATPGHLDLAQFRRDVVRINQQITGFCTIIIYYYGY